MSCIFYYSKYSENCQKYLQILSKSNFKNDIHFICIDRRVKSTDNNTYVILENGQQLLLPNTITKVPALLLLSGEYKLLFGDQIMEYLKPIQQSEIAQSTMNNMEPIAYALGNRGAFGGDVMSDQFSFVDQTSEELSVKGNGGSRQMHNYVDYNTGFTTNFTDINENTKYNTSVKGDSKISEDDANLQSVEILKKKMDQRNAELEIIKKGMTPSI